MKSFSMHSQPVWKMAAKVSALGASLVVLTYGLVWMILNTLRVGAEVFNPCGLPVWGLLDRNKKSRIEIQLRLKSNIL